MTRGDRLLLVLALAALLVAFLLAHVAPTDSHSPQAWSVPPSAIVPIVGEPAVSAPPVLGAVIPSRLGLADDQDFGGHSTDASRSHRLGTQSIAPGSPTPSVRPSHSLAELVRVGTASWYDAGSGLYAALPGPWRAGRWVTVCAMHACVTAPVVTSCVCGSHVIDLSPQLWEAVSGFGTADRWRLGVVPVSLTIGGKP